MCGAANLTAEFHSALMSYALLQNKKQMRNTYLPLPLDQQLKQHMQIINNWDSL